ncbi:hypothetical protein [Ottowia sp.]|uniref:hypothetical protein n=1 Tax=Ottowia sp. TaxID=1898956 RepID=UPI002BE9D8A0|nr:hypothetical protein [Ottowia sp.]HOB65961.1 hypothetical protein [Ottowia sp.]HQD48853.1 hypothetical protein [Ottowia sp.]
MNRRLTPFLWALNALLLAALALLWFGPGAGQRTQWVAPQPLPPNLDAASATFLSVNPAAASNDRTLLERPLFAIDRRPATAKPVAAAPEAPPPPPPDLLDKTQLRGIVRGPALNGVLAEVDGKPRFIRSGESLGDWTLRGIREREATFGKGAERRVVPLPLATASAASAAAPAGGPPPQRPAPAKRDSR